MSKRVMAQTWLPASVSTRSPIAWKTLPPGSRTYRPSAGWPFALVATMGFLRRVEE